MAGKDVQEVLDEALQGFGGKQAELARALKVSDSTVSRWYSGKSVMDFESCLRLAQITGQAAANVLRAAGHDPSLLPTGDPNSPTGSQTEALLYKRVLAEVRKLLEPLATSKPAPLAAL